MALFNILKILIKGSIYNETKIVIFIGLSGY
jgi:hypothetical protein